MIKKELKRANSHLAEATDSQNNFMNVYSNTYSLSLVINYDLSLKYSLLIMAPYTQNLLFSKAHMLASSRENQSWICSLCKISKRSVSKSISSMSKDSQVMAKTLLCWMRMKVMQILTRILNIHIIQSLYLWPHL